MDKGWSGDMLRKGWNVELKGRSDFFFGHLLAEVFGAISLCSFWRGRLKENHLSAVTGGGSSKI